MTSALDSSAATCLLPILSSISAKTIVSNWIFVQKVSLHIGPALHTKGEKLLPYFALLLVLLWK